MLIGDHVVGSLIEPGSKIRGHGKGTSTSSHAADGRQHEPAEPVRFQSVRSLWNLRSGHHRAS